MYRVESHLRIYSYYLVANFCLTLCFWVSFLVTGGVCNTVVSEEMQKMGNAFVCGFTDAFAVLWMLIGSVIMLYIIYIIWSAAEEVAKSFFPELLAYKQKLQQRQLVAEPISGAV